MIIIILPIFARLLTELPDDEFKRNHVYIEYKRKRNEERHLK